MPRHKVITDAAAKRFKPPNKDSVDHFDGSYPGLHLRVSESGLKTWGYYFRLKNGKVRLCRMKFGVYPAMSVEEAHQAWRNAFDLVQARRDPRVVRDQEKKPSGSFESVFEEWLKRDQAKNRSASRIERRIRVNVLPAWKNRLIAEIDRRAALAVIDDIADRGKVILARRVFGHLHRLFVWAVGRGIIDTNPLQHAEKPGSETKRERVLTDAELVKVWLASEKILPAYRDALRLLIMTGARKSEISGLRRDEIKDGCIFLEGERTKNGKQHIIPLSVPARGIVAGRGDGYLFTSQGRPINNWHRMKLDLDDISGVTGWTIHDLRRTCATGLQKLGVPLTVTEAVLGHVSGTRGGLVSVYQTHNYLPEKAAALESWGAHVMAIVSGTERGKVLAWGQS